jgi:hypothetical protein
MFFPQDRYLSTLNKTRYFSGHQKSVVFLHIIFHQNFCLNIAGSHCLIIYFFASFTCRSKYFFPLKYATKMRKRTKKDTSSSPLP